MFTLISALITIIWFLFTKGIWILGFSVLVRTEQFAAVVGFVKGFISRASA